MQSLKQQGFTLYMVMIIMAIIAVLTLAGGQTLNTEMRMSSNDVDKKFAFGLAEDALRAGEKYAFETAHRNKVLTNTQIINTLNSISPQTSVFFENMIGDGTNRDFKTACTNGLCAPAMEKVGSATQTTAGTAYNSTLAWERADVFTGSLTNSIAYNLGTNAQVSQNPRFIVEFLGPSTDTKTTLYRITARAWGKNSNTQVTLQSVIEVENNI